MPHTYRDLPAAGTSIQIKIGGSFVTIPGCTDINWDGFSRGVRNPTALSDVNVIKKPGMTNFGQIKSKVFYDPNESTHTAIRDKLIATAATASANIDVFKIIYADGFTTPANAVFNGFVSDFSHSATDPETGTMTADMTIEVTSVTSFSAGLPVET